MPRWSHARRRPSLFESTRRDVLAGLALRAYSFKYRWPSKSATAPSSASTSVSTPSSPSDPSTSPGSASASKPLPSAPASDEKLSPTPSPGTTAGFSSEVPSPPSPLKSSAPEQTQSPPEKTEPLINYCDSCSNNKAQAHYVEAYGPDWTSLGFNRTATIPNWNNFVLLVTLKPSSSISTSQQIVI